VVVRLEESNAPYMAGTKRSWNESVLSALSDSVTDANLVALCRYGDQLRDVRKRFGDRFVVPSEVIDGRSLLGITDVFIGMGGTMTAESALMGVPTISAFQGSLYTEDYLISVGLVQKTRSLSKLVKFVGEFLEGGHEKDCARRARRVLSSMEDPIPPIARFLSATAGQA
jgi:hypothetical protein